MTREEKIKRMVQQMIDSGVTTDREQARATVLQELRKPGGEEWLDRNLERGIDTQGFNEIEQYNYGRPPVDDSPGAFEAFTEGFLEQDPFDKKLDDRNKYGEEGDFVGEEGFLEGIYGDLFNDVESSADTEEDRLRRKIRRLNRERSHVFDDEMGYMAASDPLSYHGREQTQNLDNIREIEQLVEALQRGEADRLAGTEQTFDNRDLSLVQGNIQGALPEGLQGGLQAQSPVDPTSVSPYGISQQQLMQALQKSQMPQDQPGMNMQALAQEEQLRLQMEMANSGMMGNQLPSGLRGAFAQGIGGLPGMTRYPGLGGNKGYTGGSTPFNPYA